MISLSMGTAEYLEETMAFAMGPSLMGRTEHIMMISVRRPDTGADVLMLHIKEDDIEEMIVEAAKGLPRDRAQAVADRMVASRDLREVS